MAETETETQGSETATGEDRMDRIETKLDDLASKVASLFSKGHDVASEHEQRKLDRPSRAADQAADIQAEMRQAIADHDAQRKAEERAQGTEDRLSKVEKVLEQAPRQYRRVESFMGWPDR